MTTAFRDRITILQFPGEVTLRLEAVEGAVQRATGYRSFGRPLQFLADFDSVRLVSLLLDSKEHHLFELADV